MKRSLPILLVVGCVLLFTAGVVQLFRMRFEAGDVYPPYSSLRADPLGTMALYESLARLPEISLWRDHTTANRLPDGKSTTYLHLGADGGEWDWVPLELVQEVDRFLARGGRLVITLYPEFSEDSFRFELSQDGLSNTNSPSKKPAPADNKEPKADKEETGGGKSTNEPKASPGPADEPLKSKDLIKEEPVTGEKGKDSTEPKPEKRKRKTRREILEEEFDFKVISLRERWGIEFKVVDLIQGENGSYDPVRVVKKADPVLPESLDWHSGIVMPHPTNTWRIIYARGTNAVVIERKFGAGSIVIATDSYFLSNEALHKDRHSAFLAWLVGPSRTVVFDEAHLGVMNTSGVSTLLRKYRLYWLVASLLVLAILFIWKNAVSLVPPQPDDQESDYVPGKEASAGFINLIRRSVSSRHLLGTCFSEWKKSATGAGKVSTTRLQHAEALYQAEASADWKDRNPVRTYRNICDALKKSEFRIPKPESTTTTTPEGNK